MRGMSTLTIQTWQVKIRDQGPVGPRGDIEGDWQPQSNDNNGIEYNRTQRWGRMDCTMSDTH